ncbi:MAG: hypothetical protein WCI77_04905 [Candidatus Omnitrophota bacterium]
MCYGVPLIGAVVTSFTWHKTNNAKLWSLNLLLWGGAIFGFIDHLWNKELFLISSNIINDLLLGVAITLVIVAAWIILLLVSKINPALNSYINIKRNS